MPQRFETYKNHSIVVDEEASPPLVTIDGKSVTIVRRAGRWFTPLIAFNDFVSLGDLAHSIIDHGLIPQ
jgi:hypothetical protein